MPDLASSIQVGVAYPLGVSQNPQGLNLAIFIENARSVSLLLFESVASHASHTIPLNPQLHRTGLIWHLLLPLELKHLHYLYLVTNPDGHSYPLLDPYAKALSGSSQWAVEHPLASDPTLALLNHPRGVLTPQQSFKWTSQKPSLTKDQVVIYEMHTRGFTIDPSSGAIHPGTFLGIIEKIPYLLSLGINAIELLPITAFNENESAAQVQKGLCNYWGYSPLSFFALMNRYATCAEKVIIEFKEMVNALHAAGIEVYLDLVYNHTPEGGADGPIFSFKGLAPSIYYHRDSTGRFADFTGCGNTVNANHPVVRKMIIASIQYFAIDLQVDGFRLDLASALTRGTDGRPLAAPPLIESLSLDPALEGVKFFAEPWDAVGLYQVGSFPGFNIWSEWNGQWRDSIRRFIKGNNGQTGPFVSRICGSSDIYIGRSPLFSTNFITVHDGFTLADLVSYNSKHNEANEENNRDGSNENESWNCGIEGPTDDIQILALRQKQMRNFIVALFISQGIPLLQMGDEYGHTKNGNNNSWCHDNSLNWFCWKTLIANQALWRFTQKMIHFRKSQPLLHRTRFLTPDDITWYGKKDQPFDWSTIGHLIAMSVLDAEKNPVLFIAFNADYQSALVDLPDLPWRRCVDTSLPSPHDFEEKENAPLIEKSVYTLQPFSCIILQAD